MRIQQWENKCIASEQRVLAMESWDGQNDADGYASNWCDGADLDHENAKEC